MVEIQLIRGEIDREDDGRILASVPDLPGVMAYGISEEEAIRKLKSIALQVLADMIASGERVPGPPNGFRSPSTKTGKPAMHREGAQR